MHTWRALVFVGLFPPLLGCGAKDRSIDEVREELFALERQSHQLWLERDVSALDEIMADEFQFVAMNGAIEPKSLIVESRERDASRSQRALQVESLEVEPEQIVLRGNTAVVIGLMRINATIEGRILPRQMRVLSVFTDEGTGHTWRLTARSITPILVPAEPRDNETNDG